MFENSSFISFENQSISVSDITLSFSNGFPQNFDGNDYSLSNTSVTWTNVSSNLQITAPNFVSLPTFT